MSFSRSSPLRAAYARGDLTPTALVRGRSGGGARAQGRPGAVDPPFVTRRTEGAYANRVEAHVPGGAAAVRRALRDQGQYRSRRRAHDRRVPGVCLCAGPNPQRWCSGCSTRGRFPSARSTSTSLPPGSWACARPTARPAIRFQPSVYSRRLEFRLGGGGRGVNLCSTALGTDTAGSGRRCPRPSTISPASSRRAGC